MAGAKTIGYRVAEGARLGREKLFDYLVELDKVLRASGVENLPELPPFSRKEIKLKLERRSDTAYTGGDA